MDRKKIRDELLRKAYPVGTILEPSDEVEPPWAREFELSYILVKGYYRGYGNALQVSLDWHSAKGQVLDPYHASVRVLPTHYKLLKSNQRILQT